MELTLAQLLLLALAGTSVVSGDSECSALGEEYVVPLGEEGMFDSNVDIYLPINFSSPLIDNRVALTCTIWTVIDAVVTVAIKFEKICHRNQSNETYTERFAAKILLGASSTTQVDCSGRIDSGDKLVTENITKENSISLNITAVDSPFFFCIKLRATITGGGNASALCTAPHSSQTGEQTTDSGYSSSDALMTSQDSRTVTDHSSVTGSQLPDDVHTVTLTSPRDPDQGLPVGYVAGGAAGGAVVVVVVVLLVTAFVKRRQSKRAAAAEPVDVLELPPASGGAPSTSAAEAKVANEDNGEYDHVGRQRTPRVATGDQTYGDLAPDGDVYNHLQRGRGATAVIKGDNLYGHLGEEENAYDVTSRVTRRPEQVKDVYSKGNSQ